MSTNTFSGARAAFYFNNKQVAYASGVDGNEEYMYEPVDVLDNIEVSEYVPVGYRVSFNCAIFRTVEGATAKKGDKPAGAPPESAGFGPPHKPSIGIVPRSGGTPSEILTSGGMSASVYDRLTQKTLYSFQQVKANTYNFSITARGIVGQNVGFNAIRLLTEVGAG